MLMKVRENKWNGRTEKKREYFSVCAMAGKIETVFERALNQ